VLWHVRNTAHVTHLSKFIHTHFLVNAFQYLSTVSSNSILFKGVWFSFNYVDEVFHNPTEWHKGHLTYVKW